jgi:LacI family transcriptional regulator
MVSDPADQEHLLHTAADGVPSVVIGLDLPGLASLCAVGSESVVAAVRLVEHLTALGHRRIGFIDYEPARAHHASERELGWRQALAKAGVTPEPAWLVRADITAESGYAAARELLARGQALTALFAGNDTIAFGALRAVHEAGLRVPEDLSLVGYDDIPLAAFAHPPLTTVRTDPIAHGREAMQMLGALMRKLPVENRRAVISTELVVRGSCGPVPAPSFSPR